MITRVHDVKEMMDVVRVADAIWFQGESKLIDNLMRYSEYLWTDDSFAMQGSNFELCKQ